MLIEACQKRWTSEKMNLGQDKGGVVEKEDGANKNQMIRRMTSAKCNRI